MRHALSRMAAGLLCSMLAGTATLQAADKPASGTAAKVNGVSIPQARVDLLVKGLASQGQADSPELRKNALEELIRRELLAQESVKKGLDKNPDFQVQLDLARQGMLASAYVNEYVKANPVGDDVLKAEYEKIKTQQGGKEFKARHILVKNENDAKDAIAQIKKGAKFEKIAGEKSEDPGSKVKGGELEWATPTTYVKPFGEALAKLKKGEMTQSPVQTQFGWHVIRLDDERVLKAPPFEEIKGRLQEHLQRQSLDKMFADLRAKAKVE